MNSVDRKCWACDRPYGSTLDLSDDEADALYHHLMETIQETDCWEEPHLDSILDKLPERQILTRNPPVELQTELRLRAERLEDDHAE